MQTQPSALELLQFYVDSGVDEVVGDASVDRTQAMETASVLRHPGEGRAPAARDGAHESQDAQTRYQTPVFAGVVTEPKAPVPGAIEAMGDAKKLAAAANTIEELRAALESFDGLALKRTATQMVFADGNAQARVMFVGEAPGADEDRMGKPFVGVSGQLLDKMLAAIGLSRETNAYISNLINWRPPGNRNPSDSEIALSLPFIQRHIELVNPAAVVFVGGVAAKALLQTSQGITRLRGRWMEYSSEGLKAPIPALCLFHPAYLLRSPAQKGLAWADLLSLQRKMAALGV